MRICVSKNTTLALHKSVLSVAAQKYTESSIMRGDLHKLFAFLASKSTVTTHNHRRPRSASIACARDAANLPLHNGDGSLDKQATFLNNTLPRKFRRSSQPVIRERRMCTSKAPSRHKCKLDSVLTNPSAAFERRMVVNVNLDNSVIFEDYDNEDIRKVWSCLQNMSTFNETSVQDGYLTTTLCSTEL